MDRSYGASTSILHTPSPLDRRSPLSSSALLSKAQLAQSLAPSSGAPPALTGGTVAVQPLSFNPHNVPVRSTTAAPLASAASGAIKAVRFSPAHSSAPVSRIQGFATPPRSYSSPSLLRTAAANSSGQYGLGGGAVATPPRGDAHSGGQVQPQQQPQQVHTPTSKLHLPHFSTPQSVQSALAKSSTAVHAVQDKLSHAGGAMQEAKKKLEVMPLGRGEAARRLRVNAVLLVAWWVSSRTTLYRFAAGHLVAAAPQLDTPLHVCETLLLLLLCYNIIDSFRTLNSLSSLPPAATVGPLHSSSPARPGPVRAASSLGSLSTPARSSPKTRPSPSPFSASPLGSPAAAQSRLRNTSTSSPFRASALASPNPPTPQTPTSALRRANDGAASEAGSVLRRSLGRSAARSPAGTPLGLLRTPGGGSEAVGGQMDELSAALTAFEARHAGEGAIASDSPRSIKVESREDVERLFGDDEGAQQQ
ncbi:hypothetical protein Rhopal_004581-T1 [Rhodotorula paludigena]|uniref:Proteophosphoglycan ppg4 n=1 Tax=Rhodotorula paludigena TaxID=86838 RepID=A0AAV5GMY4_9BASI|nr:hypothetical protein Rhopal_004581-T1 [Rhodotorula paludigena]